MRMVEMLWRSAHPAWQEVPKATKLMWQHLQGFNKSFVLEFWNSGYSGAEIPLPPTVSPAPTAISPFVCPTGASQQTQPFTSVWAGLGQAHQPLPALPAGIPLFSPSQQGAPSCRSSTLWIHPWSTALASKPLPAAGDVSLLTAPPAIGYMRDTTLPQSLRSWLQSPKCSNHAMPCHPILSISADSKAGQFPRLPEH